MLLCGAAFGQGSASGTTSATGVIAGSTINVQNSGANVFSLIVNTTGSPATISIQVEGSTNNGTSYSVCGAAQTSTSLFSYICSGAFDHVQVDINSLTGGTNPTVVWSLSAWTVSDPCMDTRIPKQSAAIAISSATTTELVPTSAGRTNYVCHIDATLSGTTPTATFKTGTKVTNPCDTGAASLTGAYAPISGLTGQAGGYDLHMGYGGWVVKSSLGGEVCVTTGGTPSLQGTVIWVTI